MSSNVDLYVPQFSTLTTNQLLLSNISGTAFSNTLAFTTFSNILGVSEDKLWLKAGVYNTSILTASRYSFSNMASTVFNLSIGVSPYPMTISGNPTLYQYESTTITLQPTQFPSGYWSNVTISNFSLSLNNVFSSNSYITPTLPTGLSLGTPSPTNGLVAISGTPTVSRTLATTYFYYTRDSVGRTMSQAVPISVQKPRVIFSNVSGAPGSVATLNYGVPNDIRFSVSPPPTNGFSVDAIPSGMTLSLSGSNVLKLTGTPFSFADDGLVSTITTSNANFSGTGTLTSVFNPAVQLCNVPSAAYGYSNVTTTFMSGMSAVSQPEEGHPIAWELVGGPDTLNLSVINGVASVAGSISSNVVVQVVATDTLLNISYGASSSLYALADSVSFLYGTGPVSVSLFQDSSYDSGTAFLATASSGQNIIYTASDETALNSFQLYLGRGSGVLDGTPITVGSLDLDIYASTPQGVSATRPFSFNVASNVITFDPSYNFLNVSAHFIQGRPITTDYSVNDLTYKAAMSSGANVTQFTTSDLVGTGLTIKNRVLTGTSLSAGTFNVTLAAAFGSATSNLTLPYVIDADQLILAQPTQTDFVLELGSSVSYVLQGYTYSGSVIQSWGLAAPVTGVSVSPGGVLSLTGSSVTVPTSFTLTAQTYSGTTVTRSCTFTVNSGVFTAPTSTSAFLPIGSSLVGATDPATTLTLSGLPTGFTFSANTLSNTNGTVYPPQLVVFQSSLALNYPVRVATDTLQISVNSTSTNWIQYVPIDTITLSATSPAGGSVYITCPNPPSGLVWSPIRRTLTGSPRLLTIGDTITFWATDGYTSAALTVGYRVRVPASLRPFTSPSGYTQYVKQRAIVNGAVHAVNKTAFMPDPLIASEGGSYPPDVQKPDYACREGLVYYF